MATAYSTALLHGIRQLTNHEGLPTNAVYGFLVTLFKTAGRGAA